jgi:hypothetical protein
MENSTTPRQVPTKHQRSESFLIILVIVSTVIGVASLSGCKKKNDKSSKSSDSFLEVELPDPVKPPVPTESLTTVFPKVRGKDPLQPSAELRTVLSDLDFKDPGWRLTDIESRRPVLDAEKNGAIYFLYAANLIADNDLMIDDPFKGPHHGVSGGDLRSIVAELRKLATPLASARKLKDFPQGRFRLDIQPNPMDTRVQHLQKVRRVAKLLYFDAIRLAEKGEVDECLDDVRAIIHLTRYIAGEPTTIAQLVRVAVLVWALEALEYGLAMKAGASDKALAQMQKLLEEDGNWAALYYLLRNERATWHAVWTNTANGDTAMKYSYTDKDHLDYLNFITRAVNWAATAPEKRDRDLAEITTAYAGASEAVRSSLPDVPKIAKAVLNIECRLQAAAAAVQLERARIKDGHWPDSLGAKPPKDAYSGQPFKIVKQPQGRAVYCLFNGGDSAGTFDNLNEKTDAPHNLGFRLLDPDQRR